MKEEEDNRIAVSCCPPVVCVYRVSVVCEYVMEMDQRRPEASFVYVCVLYVLSECVMDEERSGLFCVCVMCVVSERRKEEDKNECGAWCVVGDRMWRRRRRGVHPWCVWCVWCVLYVWCVL